MTKERKQPVIRKPLIDEEAVLRFVTAREPVAVSATLVGDGHGSKAGKSPAKERAGDSVQVTLTLSRETYAGIIREAARKKRSVEELLQRHLAKQYGRD